jgi:hypothetical protein
VIQKPPKKFLLNLKLRRIKMTDRNVSYMREMWGTTKLVTDYNSLENKELLQEVTDEKFIEKKENKETELFDSWDYGLDSLTINK